MAPASVFASGKVKTYWRFCGAAFGTQTLTSLVLCAVPVVGIIMEVETTVEAPVELPTAEIPVELPTAETPVELLTTKTPVELPTAETEASVTDITDAVLQAASETEAPVANITDVLEAAADTVSPVDNITDATESLEDILDAAAAQVTQPMEIPVTEQAGIPVAEQAGIPITEHEQAGIPVTEQADIPITEPEQAGIPVTEQAGNIGNGEPKEDIPEAQVQEVSKEPGTFTLGVPGLKFSSNNVKTAKDGTKMVQIHQSQISPDQLLALQNNPNIKVVFRHVPSGKSYMKPPRHLLPPGYSTPIKKRKAVFTEEELESPDVYSFDEGEDLEGPAKRSKLGEMRAKYMHGYGNASKKKGRPRLIPDSGSYPTSYVKPSLPAKVILTDLLARVNNPNAKIEVKLHTSQINAEVLANMEVNPLYKIVLTSKQELPPLVIENVDPEEQAKLEQESKAAKEKEKQETEKAKESEKPQEEEEEKMEDVEEGKAQEDVEEEERRLEEEREKEQKEKEAARLKRLQEEEEELKKSVSQKQISRSGRIRKPSRFSLDIARLTKRKSTTSGGDSSAGEEESEQESKSQTKKTKTSVAVTSPPPKGKTQEKKIVSSQKEDEEKKKKEEEEAAKKKQEEEREKKNEEETQEKKQDVTESETEVTSTENVTAEKKDDEKATAESKKDEEKDVVSAEPDTSTDARKAPAEDSETKKDEAMSVDEPLGSKLSEEEEKEVIDNKFRLRKLLEQCSTEEIRSVMLPEAFDSINIGDFLLYKSGQMHNSSGKVNFPQLYKEFEKLQKDASKEAVRYNTLVRRANKVGGEKRMEKIVLMPVYNIEAANSLEISNSSIDAHICGIQRTITTEMIAANSFFIKSKMDSPTLRLKFPEMTVPRNTKPKQKRPLYTNQNQQPFAVNQQQQEPDSTTPDKPKMPKRTSYGQKIASMKFGTQQVKKQLATQVRRPTYIEQLKNTGQITLSGHNHQLSTKSQENLLQNIPIDTTSLLRSDVQSSQMAATATAALAQLQATVDQQQQAVVSTTQVMGTAETTLVSSATDTSSQAEQYFVTEDGVPVAAPTPTDEEGEVRKQLVPIGDGQYVELPEGYSLIQTSEGYIIGQPGSTFSQGEDGNVYITNSDGTTTEITQQDVSGATESVNVVDAVTEG